MYNMCDCSGLMAPNANKISCNMLRVNQDFTLMELETILVG
jgi:hypothetical protein